MNPEFCLSANDSLFANDSVAEVAEVAEVAGSAV